MKFSNITHHGAEIYYYIIGDSGKYLGCIMVCGVPYWVDKHAFVIVPLDKDKQDIFKVYLIGGINCKTECMHVLHMGDLSSCMTYASKYMSLTHGEKLRDYIKYNIKDGKIDLMSVFQDILSASIYTDTFLPNNYKDIKVSSVEYYRGLDCVSVHKYRAMKRISSVMIQDSLLMVAYAGNRAPPVSTHIAIDTQYDNVLDDIINALVRMYHVDLKAGIQQGESKMFSLEEILYG